MASTETQPIRVSILGTGSSLRAFHQPGVANLPGKYILHSVFERTDRGRARQICGQATKVVTTLEDVIEDPDVDLVVIATPDNTHVPYAKAALEAGKHVLIEKPVSVHASEAIELNQLAKSKGLILYVYQNRRWDSDFLTVREVIKSQRLGSLNEFTSCFDRYRPLPDTWRPDNSPSWKDDPSENHGIIYALGTHTIDQAYLLFGMPESVYCKTWDSRGNKVMECFDMDMYYPPQPGSQGPFTCHIRCNNLSAMDPQLRFVVKGSRGSYTKYGHDQQSSHLANGIHMTDPKFGLEEESAWGELVEGQVGEFDGKIVKRSKIPAKRGNYLVIYENLYEAIKTGGKKIQLVKTEDTIVVLQLIELALQSSREGRVLTTSHLLG